MTEPRTVAEMTEPDPGGAPPRILDDGTEEFMHGDEVVVQCARCGSSVMRTDFGPGSWDGYTCMSTAEFCNAHPMPGRETQKGAGRG